MMRVLVISMALLFAASSVAQAQSATETLGFLLGGFDKIPDGQSSVTENHAYTCVDETKDGCFHDDTFIKIDNCHYRHVSVDHNHWLVREKADDPGEPKEETERHVFDLDMSQAAMLGEQTSLMGEKRGAIIGGDKLDCGDMDVGDGTYCTNYELLEKYPKPVDAVRAKAAFEYFQNTFCKGRAF